jgi:hypothetical protein
LHAWIILRLSVGSTAIASDLRAIASVPRFAETPTAIDWAGVWTSHILRPGRFAELDPSWSSSLDALSRPGSRAAKVGKGAARVEIPNCLKASGGDWSRHCLGGDAKGSDCRKVSLWASSL